MGLFKWLQNTQYYCLNFTTIKLTFSTYVLFITQKNLTNQLTNSMLYKYVANCKQLPYKNSVYLHDYRTTTTSISD